MILKISTAAAVTVLALTTGCMSNGQIHPAVLGTLGGIAAATDPNFNKDAFVAAAEAYYDPNSSGSSAPTYESSVSKGSGLGGWCPSRDEQYAMHERGQLCSVFSDISPECRAVYPTCGPTVKSGSIQ